MANKIPMKSIVILIASDSKGNQVESIQVPVEDYYEGRVEVIDSADYRSERGIRLVHGEIYDPKGRVGQVFKNSYSHDGTLEQNRAVHSDGSITDQQKRVSKKTRIKRKGHKRDSSG